MTINDEKVRAYRGEGHTGAFGDLEKAYLTANPRGRTDEYVQALRDAGFTGTINDMELQYFSTEPFVPLGSGPTDEFFANVVYLNHFDGVNEATASPEGSNSAHTVVFNGNAKLSTTQALFGDTSLSLDGVSGTYVSHADSADWHFDGAFTLEMSVFRVGLITSTFMSQYGSSSNSWMFRGVTSSLRANRAVTATSTAFTNGGAVIGTANQWFGLCYERNGSGNIKLYVDGAVVATETLATALWDSTNQMIIGARDGGTVENFTGFVDEVRITKGVARYEGAYTLATEAFPNS